MISISRWFGIVKCSTGNDKKNGACCTTEKKQIQNYGQYITTVRGSQVFRRNEQQKKNGAQAPSLKRKKFKMNRGIILIISIPKS